MHIGIHISDITMKSSTTLSLPKREESVSHLELKPDILVILNIVPLSDSLIYVNMWQNVTLKFIFLAVNTFK